MVIKGTGLEVFTDLKKKLIFENFTTLGAVSGLCFLVYGLSDSNGKYFNSMSMWQTVLSTRYMNYLIYFS